MRRFEISKSDRIDIKIVMINFPDRPLPGMKALRAFGGNARHGNFTRRQGIHVDGRVSACPPAGEAGPVGPAMTEPVYVVRVLPPLLTNPLSSCPDLIRASTFWGTAIRVDGRVGARP